MGIALARRRRSPVGLNGNVESRWTSCGAFAPRDGWGAIDDGGFRIEEDPRAVGRAIEFTLVPVRGREVAVITGPARDVEPALSKTPRPAWIDVVAVVAVRTCDDLRAHIDVALVEPADADRVAVAVAATVALRAEAAFVPIPGDYVHVIDEDILVELEFDDESATWSADTSPL